MEVWDRSLCHSDLDEGRARRERGHFGWETFSLLFFRFRFEKVPFCPPERFFILSNLHLRVWTKL